MNIRLEYGELVCVCDQVKLSSKMVFLIFQGDRFLSEPRHDKLSYMEEVHSAQRKVNDLQTHLKFLESKLAERDAEIRVLQENKGESHTFSHEKKLQK